MADDAAHRLARSVRELRIAQGWTIDQLVVRSGLSKGAIVAVENGSTNPSLTTIVRLADALGTTVTALLGEPAPASVRIVPHEEQPVLWEGPFGGQAVLVLTVPGPSAVEFWTWMLMPGERYVSHPHQSGVVETITVQSGELDLVVDGESWTIMAGTTATFDADAEHTYAAVSGPTAFLMTVHLPPPSRLRTAGP